MRCILQLRKWNWRASLDSLRGLLKETPKPGTPMPPDRAELFARLHAVQTQHAQDAAVREAEIAILTQECTVAQSSADTIRENLNRKQYEKLFSSLQASAEEDRLRAAIAGKISMSLQLFLDDIGSEIAALNHRESFEVPEVTRDYVRMKKYISVRTDGPSIRRRMKALHAVRQRAQEMIFEPLTVEQLNAEILRLQKTLPAIASEVISGHRAAILRG